MHTTTRGLRSSTLIAAVCILTLATGSCLADKQEETAALELGSGIPMGDAELRNVDGETVTIHGSMGEEGTLVIFSCNSCPWVKAWEPRIAEIGNTYSQKGVGIIMINPNDPGQNSEDSYEVMQTRTKERGFEFAYAVDPTSNVARAFGATRTPEFFLFNADEELVYHGALDDNAREPEKVESTFLRDALDAMLAGETIEMTETKALGCTIKFRPQT